MKKNYFSFFFIFFLIFNFWIIKIPLLWSTTSYEDDRISINLISEVESINKTNNFLVGIHVKLKPKWHLYWKNPGDSGIPTEIEWSISEKSLISNLPWPTPLKIENISTQNLTTYGYEGELIFLTRIAPKKNHFTHDSIQLKADVSWLVCKEICLPGETSFNLKIPINKTKFSSNKLLISTAKSKLPIFYNSNEEMININAFKSSSHLLLEISFKDQVNLKVFNPRSIDFFPYQQGIFFYNQDIVFKKLKKSFYHLKIPLDQQYHSSFDQVKALLSFKNKDTEEKNKSIIIDIPVKEIDSIVTSSSILSNIFNHVLFIVFYAILGGIILNLMPCVFPILSIKVLSVVQKTEVSFTNRIKYGFIYSLGVLCSFWMFWLLIIIFKNQGSSIGWGFHFQSPIFVSVMILLFFIIGLNFSGVFEIGYSLMRLGNLQKNNYNYFSGFSNGVLMVLVSTPCMAPFLGVSLGYALSQSATTSLIAFTFVAIGLSSPYLFFLIFPQMLKWLPKPGIWMEYFKQIMAFPIYLSVVWLLSVFSKQVSSSALITHLYIIVLIAIAAWIYGKWSVHGTQKKIKIIAICFTSFLLILAFYINFSILFNSKINRIHRNILTKDQDFHIEWEKFSQKKLDKYLNDGKSVFINFTATWCLTCQVNKQTTLNHSKVKNVIKQKNIILLEADWTSYNSEITKAIYDYGRAGIPLYVYYPNRNNKEKFVILPELLTPGIFIDTINKN